MIRSIPAVGCMLSAIVSAAAQEQVIYTPYSFTTLAGSPGNAGITDGIGGSAGFNEPQGIAIDSFGNLYVADSASHTIRKITPNGVVTTIAGLAQISGNNDGTGSSARFSQPQSVTVDSSGNIYVADGGNNSIRKITPNGVVTTLAGGGANGTADGTGSAAGFRLPNGVAVDNEGNVYVTDYGNSTVRKISAAGAVTTLAGSPGLRGSADGIGSLARFAEPVGIAIDNVGNLYVGDSTNYTIRKISPSGIVSTLAGLAGQAGAADGTGSSARFFGPGVGSVDSSGNIIVTDIANNLIRRVTSLGVVTRMAGSGSRGFSDGIGGAAGFFRPRGAVADRSGNVYVSDSLNHTIRKGVPIAVIAPAITTQPASSSVTTGGAYHRTGGVCDDDRVASRVDGLGGGYGVAD